MTALIASAAVEAAPPSETFDEALRVRPLGDGGLLIGANLSLSVDGGDWRHLELFPRALAELVLGTGLVEAHVSLSKGRWLADEWGRNPAPAAAGAAVWAWLPAESAAHGWQALRSGLGALLCASLAGLSAGGAWDGSAARDGVSEPVGGAGAPWHLRPAFTGHSSTRLVLRHAASAREGVCTENVRGWLRLSPCGAASGIGALLGQSGLGFGGSGLGRGESRLGADDEPAGPLARALLRSSRYTSLQLRLLAGGCDGAGVGRCRRGLRLQLSFTAVLPPPAAPLSAERDLLELIFGSRPLQGGAAAASTRPTPNRGGDAKPRRRDAASATGLSGCALATSSTFAVELPRGSSACTSSACDGGGCEPLPACGGKAGAASEGGGGGEAGSGGKAPASIAAFSSPPHAIAHEGHGGTTRYRWALPPPSSPPFVLSLRGEPAARAAWAPPPLSARRALAGVDDVRGSLLLHLSSSVGAPLCVEALDALPSWLNFRFHTLRVWLNGVPAPLESLAPLHISPATVDATGGLLARELFGGAPYRGGTTEHVLRWGATLPARGNLTVALEFSKPLRQLDHVPADGSRGVDVGPAVLSHWSHREDCDADDADDAGAGAGAIAPSAGRGCGCGGTRARSLVFTEPLLLLVPIADASMPYNVIAISSTLIALFVGSMFNLLTRPPPAAAGGAEGGGMERSNAAGGSEGAGGIAAGGTS